MKFRYKYYGKNSMGDRVIRPVIPIKVINNDQVVRYEALVDSGADRSIFHSEVADALGIRMTAGEASGFMGATGGKARMYIHPIQIEVGGLRFDTKVAFADVLGLKGAPGLAGQVGFFNLFVVKFDYQKGVVEIKEKSLQRRI